MKLICQRLMIMTVCMLFICNDVFATEGVSNTGAVCHQRFPDLVVVIGILMLGATLIALFFLGKGSAMLRDSLPSGVEGVRPYSLGMVQMAWWFAIIVFSYVFVWIYTGCTPAASASLLSLAGISGATGATSVAIADAKNTKYPTSERFWRDILTDKDGITLHRFQMLAMTLILGVIFIIRVISDDSLPQDFDTTTLGLMGISSGVYLGFKIPEKQTSN